MHCHVTQHAMSAVDFPKLNTGSPFPEFPWITQNQHHY